MPVLTAKLLAMLHCRTFGDVRVNASDFTIVCGSDEFHSKCLAQARGRHSHL